MMKRPRLMDPDFKYTSAAKTNIRITFARIRREMKEAERKQPTNVKPLKKRDPK